MMLCRSRRAVMQAAAAMSLGAPAARAQAYPSRPVRLVVPFAPGGAMDLIARLLAESLATSLGQSVVVENRTGAGGSIGTGQLARTSPDGYSLLFSNPGPTALRPAIYTDLPYDTLRDFTFVSGVARSPLVLVVSATSPVRSAEDLIAVGRSGKAVNYGSSGIGSQSQVGCEWFKLVTGTDFLHVPLTGAAPIVTELLAGRVDFSFLALGDVLPRMRDGQLRGLAIARGTRSVLAPDLPTLAEIGLPTLELDTWYALLGPAGLPVAVTERLHHETTATLAKPAFQRRLQDVFFEPLPMNPQQTRDFMAADIAKYAEIVRAAKIRAE